MSSNRLSGLNVVLLVVAAASLMFGAYSFIANGGDGPAPRDQRTASTGFDSGEAAPAAQRDTPLQGASASSSGKSVDVAQDGSNRPPSGRPAEPAQPVVSAKVASSPSDSGSARLSGTVIGPDGTVVAGASVTARNSDLRLEPPELAGDDLDEYRARVNEFLALTQRETRTTVTNREGRFTFEGLDESRAYDLAARSDSIGSGDQRRVAAGDEVIILLSAESLLRGRVESADGKPVTSFSVRAWRQGRQWEQINRSFQAEDGRFSIPAKTGTMQVEVTAPGFTQGETRDVQVGGDEALIVVASAAILSGTVRDTNGRELSDVTVRVGAGGDNRRNWGQQEAGQSVTTDSKGRYRFDTLQPKETRFTASIGEMSDTHTVDLTAGENSLDFTLNIGGVVRVRSTGPDGSSIELDSVWFQHREAQRNWPRAQRLAAREPGLAEFAGLHAGPYRLTATAAGFPAITLDVDVKEGANDLSLNFTVGATIKGVVKNSAGSAMANLGVRLRKEDEERWGGWGTGRYAQVDAHGAYRLGPAEPGVWRIEVYTTDNWAEVHSETVTLGAGEVTRDLVVDSGATVVIKVVDESGTPVNRANVQLNGERSFNGTTNAEGVVTIPFVASGSYAVLATGGRRASRTTHASFSAGNNTLSITVQDSNSCRLTHIYPDSQASRVGLQVGDLVVTYNGQQITSWRGLGQAIRATRASDDVVIVVDRSGSQLTFYVKGGTLGVEGADGVR